MGSARTIVFVHAHPDDEALLTAGTMARASAEGHRVVLVVATDGAAGLTDAALTADLAATRAAELEVSAAALGVARTVRLGFADSGLLGDVEGGFASADPDEVAARIAAICDRESAHVLVGYDPSGGYGHPDHLQVHRTVRLAAARCTRTPVLFEATLPREPIRRAVRTAAAVRLTPSGFDPTEFDHAWTPNAQITHRVNVRDHLTAKSAALQAHASQATADGTTRTLGVLTQLPKPALAALLGTEYYVVVPAAQRSGRLSRTRR